MTATRLQDRNFFENASAGQTAIRNLATAPTYLAHYIQLEVQGVGPVPNADWATYISEVRVRRNGQDTIKWDVAELLKYNRLMGINQTPGILPIMLTMPYARTLAGETIGAHTTLGLSHYSIEVDIKDGVQPTTLRLHTKESAPQEAGPVLNVRRYSGERTATGDDIIDEITTGPYFLAQILINKGDIGQLEAVITNRDGKRIVLQDTNPLSRSQLYLDARRVIQPSQTLIDFAPLNQVVSLSSGEAIPEILNMDVQSLELELNWTVAPGPYQINTIELRNEL